MSQLTIRFARDADVTEMSRIAIEESAHRVLEGVACETKERYLASLAPESFAEKFTGEFDYLVAEKEGQLTGFVGIQQRNHLYHLFVDARFQRQGIARSLMDECLALLRKDGVKELTVNSSVYAQPVYTKLGFVTLSDATERNGLTCVSMKRVL